MRILGLFAALTWLLVAKTTLAQSKDAGDADTARAATRFQQAVELYREGSFEGALAEFRKAYQIRPSYQVLYNISQVQHALHDYVGAYKSLEQYLAEGSSEIPADRRAQVEEMRAKLEDRIAHLQIVTNLKGADVRIDGVSAGFSPLLGLVPVNVGTHRVTAAKPGFAEVTRTVTVAGKETAKTELRIDEPLVSLSQPALGPPPLPVPQLVKAPDQTPPSRAGLVVSVSVTAALAVGTGVFAYLALGAQKDLTNQVNTYPTTRDNIEEARSKSRTYGYVTDALGAATLVSGGVAIYMAIVHGRRPSKPKPTKTVEPLVLAPTVGGMVLRGRF